MLPPEVHNALSNLLEGLQSADSDTRTPAEEQLNNDWVQTRPDLLLMGLVEQAQGQEQAAVRPLRSRQECGG